jgi:hypothetical protein
MDTLETTALLTPYSHKQLFFDDHALASTHGLTRRFHQPHDHQAVLRPARAVGQVAVQSRSAPQWNRDKAVWEWWYWGYTRVPPHGPYATTEARANCYATSTDGVTWETPDLGLYTWQGTLHNNVALHPDAETLYHILRDERERDPQRRYKALFGLGDRQLGVSPDGFAWTMLDAPPIKSQDESHFLQDANGEFLAYIKQPTAWGRSVWLATSHNFATFTPPQLVLHSDELDQRNRSQRVQASMDTPALLAPPLIDGVDYIAEIYQMAVMPYAGIYVGFPVLFNPAGAIPRPHGNYTALNQVELTFSRDRVTWTRLADRALFLPIDPADEAHFGWAQKLLCGAPCVQGDEIWLYYNALRFRGPHHLYQNRYPELSPHFYDDESALVLAKLRLDGFVSLDADGEGTLVTAPFVAEYGLLCVNVDASKGGELVVEVLDAATLQPLAGYGAQEAEPVSGDRVRAPVQWAGHPWLPQAGMVRLRFTLRGARLYAFWVER